MNKRPTVLILSSNSAFSRELTRSWPVSGDAPEFVLLEEDLCSELQRDTYDLAIAEAVTTEKHAHIKKALVEAGKPAIVIYSDPVADVRNLEGPVVDLSRSDPAWASTATLLGREMLRRVQSESRASEAERLLSAAHAEATLGRYMVEMHSSVNNALTSVLGNAELLKLEPGLPAAVLAQADTIHNMALRLHEVFQRFSSLEKELYVAARESGKQVGQARAAATGS